MESIYISPDVKLIQLELELERGIFERSRRLSGWVARKEGDLSLEI